MYLRNISTFHLGYFGVLLCGYMTGWHHARRHFSPADWFSTKTFPILARIQAETR